VNKLLIRTKLAGNVLRFVPFLKMAALNGSVVRGEETKKSDIDVLIIAKSGRLYTCRFFAVLLIHLTGWRRHGKKTAGRICLNCYLNDQRPIIFPNRRASAYKVAKSCRYQIALVDDGKSFKKFEGCNPWLKGFSVGGRKHSKLLKDLIFNDFPKKPLNNFASKLLSGWFGSWLEGKLMNYQVKRILSKRQQSDEIFADEFCIKLHPKKH
jgi:hypothetical protein